MEAPPAAINKRRIMQIAVLGDGRVGKTALLRVLKGRPFEFTYTMTIGADYVIKRMKDYKGYDLTLQIYDVGGQPKFSHLRSKYYSNAEAVIIVFDLMRRETFDNIPNWLDEVLQNNNYRFLPLLLIGNKEDLAKPSEISQSEIDQYVEILENWGREYDPNFTIFYAETSAKTGLNVEESFQKIIDQVL